ncbi:hypothetical protein A9Q82_00890 [Cycloclasticus sp. 46_120_T64]|nr:hypothetical protein A9Q82_00890 [Cycloclasticus sp. 46_120_T64]
MKHPLAGVFCSLIAVALLSACSQRYSAIHDSAPSNVPANIENIPDAIPRVEAKSRGGNPPSYQVFGKTYHVLNSSRGFVEQGIASWYGSKFHGHKTSNGEIYNMYAMTAAHKSLPIPSYVEVKNLSNGKTIIVRVNDRGPFHPGRIIDLSYAAAAKLGTLKHGTSPVKVTAIDPTNTANVTTAPAAQLKYLSPPAQEYSQQIPPGIYLQLGAFNTLQNANRLKAKLSHQLALQSNIKQLEKTASTLYLVRIGPYPTMAQAELDRLKLQRLGIHHSHFVSQ